jgi:HK97 family phage prohead protease
MQHKNLELSAIALKFDDSRPGFFSGYASKFGGVDSYGDTILPGAYKKTLRKRERPVLLRWNHYGPVIGKWTKLEEDDAGLYVEGELTLGHSVADDAYALLKHGAVTGLSIGYRIVQVTDRLDGTRDLKELQLIEISVVETPADLAAQIGDVKGVIDGADSLKEIEALLRDAAGFSRADATALVSRVKSLCRGEHDAHSQTAAIAGLFQQFTTPQP